MKYGSEEIVKVFGDDEVGDLSMIHNGEAAGTYKRYKRRHFVNDQKEEASVYLQFSSDMKKKRDDGVLYAVKDDPTTTPCFNVRYPHKNVDGSYMVITSWTERMA